MHAKRFDTFLKDGCNSVWVQFHVYPSIYTYIFPMILSIYLYSQYIYLYIFPMNLSIYESYASLYSDSPSTTSATSRPRFSLPPRPTLRPFKNPTTVLYIKFVFKKVFVSATKPTAQRKKNGFISYSPDYPPINSRIKIKQFFFLLLV